MFLLSLLAKIFILDDVRSGTLDDAIVVMFILSIAGGIGLISTFLVFRNASKIGGGALTRVYKFFAAGMFCIVCGVFTFLLPPDLLLLGLNRAGGIFFMIGFTLMGVGANKILDAVGIK